MIDYIGLQNFTNFNQYQFFFSKGINIFIGKNGTGKTHILKNIAATIDASNVFNSGQSVSSSATMKGTTYASKLMNYFKPDNLGNLVQKTWSGATIHLSYNNEELEYSLSSTSKSSITIKKDAKWEKIQSLYIPPREMFSLFEGFIGLTEKREISFDETYIAFAKALNVPLLKADYKNPLQSAIDILENELHFKVIQQNGRFYIKTANETLEAHLVAEGFRKLASIMYLILNGELKENSILFWDEPEANLNPALINVVAKFILELERHGIQIFIATHDYLLTHILSLNSEYKKTEAKFFCLLKNSESEQISVEEGDTLTSIENNPILDEYAAYYDLEQTFINSDLTDETI
ncbi:ATP-binding protein [Bacteroidia bacterium]|nr:ATP-binding protein [Bacteroidia bacterium]